MADIIEMAKVEQKETLWQKLKRNRVNIALGAGVIVGAFGLGALFLHLLNVENGSQQKAIDADSDQTAQEGFELDSEDFESIPDISDDTAE